MFNKTLIALEAESFMDLKKFQTHEQRSLRIHHVTYQPFPTSQTQSTTFPSSNFILILPSEYCCKVFKTAKNTKKHSHTQHLISLLALLALKPHSTSHSNSAPLITFAFNKIDRDAMTAEKNLSAL